MRKAGIAILISLNTFIFAGNLFAVNPTPGTPCAKSGLVFSTSSKKFTCIKSGKKLIWNKGVALATSVTPVPMKTVDPTPTPTPTPTATKAAFVPPIPITIPLAPATDANAITFENILNRISDIPTAAFNKAESTIGNNSLPAIPHEIFVAPGLESLVSKSAVESLLSRAFKYYSGFQQSTYFGVYIYNKATVPWAINQYEKEAQTRNYSSFKKYQDMFSYAANGACDSEDCFGSQSSIIPGTNEGFLCIPIDNGNHWDLSNGTLAHSYGHTVQSAQWDGTEVGNVGEIKNAAYTGWLFQGGVTQPSWTIATGTLSGYMQQRNWQGFNLRGSGIKNLSAQSLTNYLLYSSIKESIDINGNRVEGSAWPPNPIFQIGNSTGSLAVEALVAIGGPQAVMALQTLQARGNSMDSAFMQVYGVPWSQAAATLGQVIAQEYSQRVPTP